MSVRHSGLYRGVLVVLSAACLGGAGYLGYRTFVAPPGASQTLKSAEDAYARGVKAYDAKDFATAAGRFDEAKLLASKALDQLTEEGKKGKASVSQEEFRPTNARMLYLKALAIRDQAFARAAADGKPIAETTDTSTGKTFRNVLAVPDAEARSDAVGSVILAARLDTESKDSGDWVQDALRVSLSMPALNWADVEPFCRAAVRRDPKDSRAQFTLARFEFEQPVGGGPTPPAKRDRERVEKAREHLKLAKDAGSPYWRTVHLEAQVLRWLAADTARRSKPADAFDRDVRALLLDDRDGALARADRGEKFSPLAKPDVDGIVGVHLIAAELAAGDGKGGAADPALALRAAQGALKAANRLADDPAVKGNAADLAAALAAVAAATQPALSAGDGADWRQVTDGVKGFLAEHPGAAAARPGLKLAVAELAARQASLTARKGDVGQAQKLSDEAVKALEDGLAAAEAAKEPTDEFHARLAEIKLARRAKADEVERHLTPLRRSASPTVRAFVRLLDGKLAVRQGRLSAAKKILDPLVNDAKAGAGITLRASATLANVFFMLGDPAGAINLLREVEAGYAKIGATDQDWVTEEFPTPDDVASAQAVAQYAAAVQRVARASKDAPGKPLPADLVSGYEAAAAAQLQKLRAPTAADRQARLALARYLALTNRKGEAEAKLAALAADYPDNLDVLTAQVQQMVPAVPAGRPAPADRFAKADARMKEFVARYGADPKVGRTAKLAWSAWLVQTGRSEAAAAYLNDPANFPAGADPVVDRLRAAALIGSGKREEGQRILKALPPDAAVSDALIRGAATAAEREKELTAAIGRYENNGYFRMFQAYTRLADGKYEEAVRGFAGAAEVAGVEAAARTWLYTALVQYAQADPAKARELAVKLTADLPDEPGLYAAAALAARMQEDIGTPADAWEQTKTMYAAVNRWEQAATKAGLPRPQIALAKASFHLEAGDVAAAKAEAARSAAQNPDHAPTQLLLAGLSVEFPDGGDPVGTAKKYADAAFRADPDNPQMPWVEAQLKELAGDKAGAIAAYERLASVDPRNGRAYAKLIALTQAAGQKDAALRWAMKWQGELPNDAGAAAEVVRLLAQAGSKPEAKTIADDFVAKVTAEAQKRAAANPPAAGAVDPVELARAEALFVTAGAFYRAGDFAEADARLGRLPKDRQAAEAVLLMRGDIALVKQDWDGAVAVYRQLLDRNPRHFIAGNNAAWVLAAKKNDPAGALRIVEDVRKGLAGRPIGAERLPPDFLDTIGVVYRKLDRADRYTEMRELFEAAARRYPTDPRMHLFLGEAQAALKENSRAMATLDTAVRLATQPAPGVRLTDEQKKEVLQTAEAVKKRLRS
jgi:hypothetical protein